MNADIINLFDTVSILDGEDILLGAVVWEIAPFTITFQWQGSIITQARARAEIHTELQSRFDRNQAIAEILEMIA